MLKPYKKIITAFSIVFLFGLIAILKLFPQFVETYYSNGIYIFLSKLMRYVFGWLPFSVGDILYTLASVYALRWLVINRKRILKDTKNWILDVFSAISVGYITFHILWAFNYYRQPLYKSLDIEAEYSTEQLLSFTEKLIVKSNTIHSKLATNDTLKVDFPFTKSEIFDKVKDGYKTLSVEYPHLDYQPQSIKKSIYSIPLAYMGFSGYLNPFTNEAQVDGLIPTYKFPTTSCHEVAHQLGYAAENEANFIGSLAAIHNEDIYFKYSGYTFALRHCLAELYQRDSEVYHNVLETVNKGIIKNYLEVQDFWKAYQNPLEPVFKKTFDNFLKVNNQSDGMKSYNYVVALYVNYYQERAL